jgi:enoyl-CoA hydratase/carnithine racemase
MKSAQLLVERLDGGVGFLVLNRPEVLNAFNASVANELIRWFRRFAEDDDVKCVVLTGAGIRAFCSGGDLHELKGQSQDRLDEWLSHWSEIGWELANFNKPTIAAVNGVALGGGALLATQCDIRVGCPQSQFRFLAATYGQVNSTWTLPRIVGCARAKELLFTGRPVESQEAMEIGLLNQVVSTDELVDSAMAMARLIAGNDPVMVQGIKALMNQQSDLTWRQMFEAEGKLARRSSTPIGEGFSNFFSRTNASSNASAISD